jgi:transmembrane sensor
MTKSPEHAAAYHSIEHAWLQLKSASDDPLVRALRQDTARRVAASSTTSQAQRWAAASLIIFSLGTASWFLAGRAGLEFSSLARLKTGPSAVTQSYTTNTGERLAVTLADGSKVTLNTATQLNIAFSKADRVVRLLQGQALFEVAKDKMRPFVVQTQNGRFVAVGTAFDVYIDQTEVKVTMLDGTVRAESIDPSAPSRVTVTAGEQLTADSHFDFRIRRVNAQRETSWRRGQLIFDDTPLREAIEELNRYSSTHIVVADPKVAELRLSGTFSTEGSRAFVEAVTAYFPIQAEHTDATTVTLKARD